MAEKPTSTARKPAASAGKLPAGVFALPKPPRAPRVPVHLSAPMRRWWAQVARTYELEPHHLLILTAAAESHDLMVRARELIDRDGLTFTDKHGQPRARPEVQIEHHAKIAFARLLRELALDVSVDAPRGPGLHGRER